MTHDEHSHPPGAEPPLTEPGAVVRGPGYEVRDTNVAGIITFVVGLILSLIVTQVGLWGLIKAFAGPPSTEPPRATPYAEPSAEAGDVPKRAKVTPEVVLEIAEQRRQLRAREDALLGSIDRAIDQIAERGLPPTGGPPRTEVELNSHSGVPATPENQGKKVKEEEKEKEEGAKK